MWRTSGWFSRPLAALFVVLSLLSSGLVIAEYAEESPSFPESFSTGTWQSGWANIDWRDSENSNRQARLYYPSDMSGEGVDMADISSQSPLLVWFTEDGVDNDDYDWLGEPLAQSGYLVAILGDEWNPDSDQRNGWDMDEFRARLVNINASGGGPNVPDGMIGQLDTLHWMVGGHGRGAATALTQIALWDTWHWGQTTHPPRGVIGLGLEKVSGLDTIPLTPPDPAWSLFLTGTVDEVTPSLEHAKSFLAGWNGGWQLLEVVGANHNQYRDDSSWWDDLGDGTATITREAQHVHALDIIMPNIELILKGNHNRWADASNREDAWDSAGSDSASYQTESLSGAQLLRLSNLSGPLNASWSDSITLSVDLHHRDMTAPTRAEVLCEVEGNEEPPVIGNELLEDGIRKGDCVLAGYGITPGTKNARISVYGDGLPAHTTLTFEKLNTPLEVNSPVPSYSIDQHETLSILPNELAVDPDGVQMYFESAELVGENASEMQLDPVWWGSEQVTVSHPDDSEWSGIVELLLRITEQAPEPVTINVTVNITVGAVNDQLLIDSPLPNLEAPEDSQAMLVNLSDYFHDPEGVPLQTVVTGVTQGINAEVISGTLQIESEPNWNGFGWVNMEISDGVNEPIVGNISVTIFAVPDPPLLNLSEFNISLMEEERADIPLSLFGHDPDGDTLNWTLIGEEGNISASVWGDILIIQPNSNWWGECLSWELIAADETHSEGQLLNISVTGVNDPPVVDWANEMTFEGSEVYVRFNFTDSDGPGPWNLSHRWDDLGGWVSSAPNCQVDDEEIFNCYALFSLTNLTFGDHKLSLRLSDGADVTAVESGWLHWKGPESNEGGVEQSLLVQYSMYLLFASIALMGGAGLLLVRKGDD